MITNGWFDMAKRNERTAVAAGAPAPIPTPRTMADVIAIAKTVTPDTFATTLRAVNAGVDVAHGSRNLNRFDNTRIQFTQNRLFIDNPTHQLTDVQLAFVWCACFPMASGRAFDANRAIVTGDESAIRAAIVNGAKIVNGARGTFNHDGHGMGHKPAVPSVRYGVTKTTFATAPTPTPTPTPTPAPSPASASAPRLRKR